MYKMSVLLSSPANSGLIVTNYQALDKVSFSDGQFNRRVHRLLVKLSEICDKIPSSLFITGVHAEIHTSFRGTFSNVFQASYQHQMVAIKRMRIFQTSENRLDIFRVSIWKRTALRGANFSLAVL